MEINEEKTEKEYYASVVWKDVDGKVHIVGSLAYFDGKYYFKYEKAYLEKARDKGFIDVASFNDDDKLYISENSLFSFFKNRVSPKVKLLPDAMEELIRTGGHATNDDIYVIHFPDKYKLALKAEIMGMEREQNEMAENKKAASQTEAR